MPDTPEHELRTEADIIDILGINGLFFKLNLHFKQTKIGINIPSGGVINENFDFSKSQSIETDYFIEYVHGGFLESRHVQFLFKLKDLQGYKGTENQFALYFRDNICVTLSRDRNKPLTISISSA